MIHNLRICFVGDSYVAGVGDPRFLGWAGRLAARTISAGQPITGYNLGVRRQTSADILSRFEQECVPRLEIADDPRVVLSLGTNDATHEDGRPRVAPAESAANLALLLDRAAARGWATLVVAPPPVADLDHRARTALLDAEFVGVCRAAGVPYIQVHQPLSTNPVWLEEIRLDDGAHPGAAGYDEITALIAPHWDTWLASGR
ncbi:GDSL-type esterase/lipase family protein [Kitasatospora sp. NPDC002040]|uniref:GDSL-type esterase/lipase family protein n=1 Tax=Kitasatospora sp. NPDC002040 TaxID=3154661 RepID=UPI003324F245